MSENDYIMETIDSSKYLQTNEIFYNCTECSSSIEILSIDNDECSIEFKCLNENNSHNKKTLIKEYINKMKDYNNIDINNDKCKIHDNQYEYYCLECNIHLCKECIKLKKHINHIKIILLEIQPSEKILNIFENMIKYYEDIIENIEKEKLRTIKYLQNKLEIYKNKLNDKKELKLIENKNKMEKELKLNNDTYINDIKEIIKKYMNEINLRKYKFENDINKIKNKYKLINEHFNIIYKNKIEESNINYKKILDKYEYDKKIDNMNNIKKLNEIIYNTYIAYNNNYFNSLNIINVLFNYHNKNIYNTSELIEEFENIMKMKKASEKRNYIVNCLKTPKKFRKKEVREIKYFPIKLINETLINEDEKENYSNNHRLFNTEIVRKKKRKKSNKRKSNKKL